MRNPSAARPARQPSGGAVKTLTFAIGLADGSITYLTYAAGLPPIDRTDTLLPLGIVFIGVFAGTLIHELGHAIAAIIVGWRIIIFAVRPFALHLVNANFVFGGKKTFPGRLGFVVAVPASRDAITIGRWAAFIAGGPIASFLFGLYAASAALLLSRLTASSPNIRLVTAIRAGFAIHSLCVCILTLLPMNQPNLSSDGSKLRRAFSDPHKQPERTALFWLLAMMRYKIRPRDLPEWIIRTIRADATLPLVYDSLEIAQILDAKSPNVAEARKKLEEFRERHGATAWQCACDAYVAALYEGDVDRAAKALAISHTERQTPELTSAAHAALSARLGLPDEVHRRLAEMDKHLYRNSPFDDRCYADIRSRIEALLHSERQIRATRRAASNPMGGSVPNHF